MTTAAPTAAPTADTALTHHQVPPDPAVNLTTALDDPDYDLIKDVRTSDDVVEFYAKYGQDSPVKFFFCRPAPAGLLFRPYDLVVVRREEAGDYYYTMSATGVMRMQKGVRAGVLLQR